MCLNPTEVWINLGDGVGRSQMVACHRCFQCIDRIVLDFQGRCTAEARSAVAAHFVTLTYGRDERGSSDHARAAVFMYSDVQKLLKLLRKWGYPARYFVSGEFGEKKGRVHWHILLFWEKAVPPGIVLDEPRHMWARFDDQGEQAKLRDGEPAWFWEHGFAHFRTAHSGSVRYACDYAMKELSKGEIGRRPGMSKKPPLGTDYFLELADEYARKGVAPQGHINEDHGTEVIGQFRYGWQDVVYGPKSSRAGQTVPFHLARHSATEKLFLDEFLRCWQEYRPDQPIPHSRLVEEFIEPGTWANVTGDMARERADDAFERWVKARKRWSAEDQKEAKERRLARIERRKRLGYPDPYGAPWEEEVRRSDFDHEWEMFGGSQQQYAVEVEQRFQDDRLTFWEHVHDWEIVHKEEHRGRYAYGRILPPGFGYQAAAARQLPASRYRESWRKFGRELLPETDKLGSPWLDSRPFPGSQDGE